MPTTDNTRTPPWTLLAGMVLLALGVGAYLTLVLTGHEAATDKLLTFIGPSVAALIVVGHQQRQQAETNTTLEAAHEKLEQNTQALAVITSQTNGVLDQRIKDRTTDALREYDIAGDVRSALTGILEARLEPEGAAPAGP